MNLITKPEIPEQQFSQASPATMPRVRRLQRLTWLPIPAFLLAAALLYALHLTTTFESPVLLAILNTLFCTAVSLLIVLLAARSYQSSGSRAELWLGCGALAYGLSYVLVDLLLSRLNVAITFSNSSLALAGMFFLLSAGTLLGKKPQRSAAHWFILACLGVLLLLGVLLWGASIGFIPPFYLAGHGMTAMRQIILIVTFAEFLLASLGFMSRADQSAARFHRWCGIGLALIGLGLGALIIGGRPATPLGWLGRAEGYLGGIYLFIAIFSVAEGVNLLPLERALYESEERFSAAFEQGAIGMALAALDGRFLQVNAAFCQMLGYTQSELLRLSYAGITHPDDLPANLAGLRQISSGEAISFRMEKRYLHKDGHLVWVDMSTVVVCDVERKPRYYVTHLVDITERKRAEQALQTTLQRFDITLSSMYSGVLLVTDEGLVEYANQGFCDLFGLGDAPMALVGLNARAMIERIKKAYRHPDEAIARILEILERGAPVRGEEIAMRDGGTFLRDFVPLHVLGQLNGRLWIHFDISERKRAEEAVRELTQRLTYHVDNSPLAVIEWGPDMRLIRWSGAAERLFGWTAEEVLGKRMEEFRWIYQEDQTQVAEVSDELQTGSNPRRFSSNRNYRKDGSVVHCEWYNSSLVNESGTLRSILSLVLDVTERMQAEEALQISLREKEVLLKEIHHRVKNNMQVISSLVSLQADTIDNPELHGLFNDLRDRVRSMALVHEKLYQSESLAVVDFAEYTRSLLNYLWRAHGVAAAEVRLTLDVQPVSLSVETAVPCGLILNELVTNALKHAFRERADGDITVRLHAVPDGCVCLRVSDNGAGLPADLDWRQAPSLGLRLVQMLAGQLRGTLEVHSDGGTTFALTFARPIPKQNGEERHAKHSHC